MGKFDGVLLASDYDDTLYGTDMTVSAENVKAIEYFTAQGGTFTVATGAEYKMLCSRRARCLHFSSVWTRSAMLDVPPFRCSKSVTM